MQSEVQIIHVFICLKIFFLAFLADIFAVMTLEAGGREKALGTGQGLGAMLCHRGQLEG